MEDLTSKYNLQLVKLNPYSLEWEDSSDVALRQHILGEVLKKYIITEILGFKIITNEVEVYTLYGERIQNGDLTGRYVSGSQLTFKPSMEELNTIFAIHKLNLVV